MALQLIGKAITDFSILQSQFLDDFPGFTWWTFLRKISFSPFEQGYLPIIHYPIHYQVNSIRTA
jgi:hypothetical protein